MIRTTPFHPRVEALNQTGLYSHWSGYLVADKYQTSEKFEYFAIRTAAGIFDTSPLYKYRIGGTDAERFLTGVLARDIRTCRPGRAQYTIWCDDDGYLLEDGIVLRLADDEFLLAAARPNLAYLEGLRAGMSVGIEDVSDRYGAVAVQGPRSRSVLAAVSPETEQLAYFDVAETKLADRPVVVSRTGFTGDLGYEIWVEVDDALAVWDVLAEAGRPHGLIPFGQIALTMARIEAGLLLIDVDFRSARFAWTEAQKSTPLELGMGWMVRDLERPFVGRDAIRRELAGGESRYALVGVTVDWRDWDAKYTAAGLVPPKNHLPVEAEMMLYDGDMQRAGWVSSFMYSPVLQVHVGIARVRPELSASGTEVNLEITIDHEHQTVAAHIGRLPFFDPARKTS